MNEPNIPDYINEYVAISKECSYPVKLLLQTPRKGELVDGLMEEDEWELHEFAAIHDCQTKDVDNMSAIYNCKFAKDMDIMSMFPVDINDVDGLLAEMKSRDGYEVIKRY